MNITHAKEEEVKGDLLEAIFERQKELMEKYHEIELNSGLLQTSKVPVNLDDKFGQARLKDFAWRFTEEIGEALDARNNQEHYQEELIDALHFLTEFTILADGEKPLMEFIRLDPDMAEIDGLVGIYSLARGSYNELFGQTGENRFNFQLANLIENMGMACNCLKNKPWKQSHMLTDRDRFYERLNQVWVNFFQLLISSGFDHAKEIANIYLKKSQVNKFRQRSGY